MKLNGKRIQEFLGVAALGSLFTALLTWPLFTKLSVFYKDDGDFPLNGWILWYNQWAMKTGRIFHQFDYFNSTQIYPLPYTLAYSDHVFVPSLFFSPIYWLTHQLVFSVNFFALLTFVLSFIASYFTLKYFIKNPAACILGAIVYTFNPITFSAFPDHLQLMNKYFLPPLFLFAYQYFKEPRWTPAFLFCLFFTLNALSSIYFFIFTLVLLPLCFLPFLIVRIKAKDFSYFISLVKYGTVILVFLPVLWYFNAPYMTFSHREGIIRNLDVQRYYSSRLIDWVSPVPHTLFYEKYSQALAKMKAVEGFLPNQERCLFLNILPSLFAIAGIFCLLKRKLYVTFWALCLPLIGAFVFSFGPYFLGWNLQYGSIKLPFYYLYEVSPLLDGIRGPTRFQFFFYIPFSIFSAYGAAYLLELRQKRVFLLSLFLITLLVLENYTVNDYNQKSEILSELSNPKKDRLSFLQGTNTFHLPTFVPDAKKFYWESGYLSWATQTYEKTLNGYSGYFPYDWVNLLEQIQTDLNPLSLAKLKALDVDFVILHKSFMSVKRYQAYQRELGGFYKKLIFFEDPTIAILNLQGFPPIKTCNFDKDILKKNFNLYTIDGLPTDFEITLHNSTPAYLASMGASRYAPVEIRMDNTRRLFYLRLPLLLAPQEETVARGFMHKINVDESPIRNANLEFYSR